MRSMLKKLLTNEKLLRYCGFAVLVLYIATLLTVNFAGIKSNMVADMYSDINLAKMMWEQKSLFPEGWIFGNQYYVIATPVLCSLIYGFVGDGVLAMSIATTIMTALILASFIWMLSPLVKNSTDPGFRTFASLAALSTVICVNAPFSRNGQLFYTMASYYACYVIVEYLAIGHYVRLLHTERSRRDRAVTLAVISVLCFCSGMQSLRQTAVLILPLCGFEALRLAYEYVIEKKKVSLLPTAHTAIISAANILGWLVMKLMKVPNISIIYGSTGGVSAAVNRGGFGRNFEELAELLGFDLMIRPEKLRLLLVPALSLFCIGVTVLAAVMLCRRRELHSGFAAIMLILALSVAAVFAAGLFTNLDMRSIYFFTVFPLFAAAFAYCLERFDGVRRGAAVAVLLCFALVSAVCSYVSPLKVIANGEIDARNRAMTEWMMENDYDIVYGGWDICEKAAVESKGQIKPGYGVFSGGVDSYQICRYLNYQDIYSEEDNARAVYILAPEHRDVMLQRAKEMGAEMTLRYVSEDGAYELYTSSKQLMHFGS